MKENYWIRDGGELATDSFKCADRRLQMPQEHLKDKQHHYPDGLKQHWRKPANATAAQVKPALQASERCNNNNNNNKLDIEEGPRDEARRKSGVEAVLEPAACKSKRVELKSEGEKHLSDELDCEQQQAATCRIVVEGPSEDEEEEKTNNKQIEHEKQHYQQQQKAQQQVKKSDNDVNLSFCGCGFLGIYHVGVASCFHEYAPQLSMHKISGSSAGALVAVAHICGNLQLAYATTDILRVAIDARSRALGPFHPSFDINAMVREALERGLPEDVHLKASGKLHISLTRVYDGQNVIISQFDCKEDVIQALICSCFIPYWSGLKMPKFKGITYIDGGFSNNLLVLDDQTVTVSPFAGEADICPQDDTFNLLQVNLSNTSFSLTPDNLYRLSHALLPPKPEVLSDLCEQGFADGIRFLQRMKLISCNKCLEIRSSLLVTENGEDIKEAVAQQVTSSRLDTNPDVDYDGDYDDNDDAHNYCNTYDESTCDYLNFSTEACSSDQASGSHHIRLEQREQKTIEINGSQTRRDSVVSTNSAAQVIHQHHTTKIKANNVRDSEKQQQPQRQQSKAEFVNSCDQCQLIRQKALRGTVPKQFSDRIRDACDTVNKSLSNWIYSHRPIKYLSYLAAPYYLPVDISLALVYKCWQSLPIIRSELVDCVYNIVEFLIGILKRMNANSMTSKLIMSACSWEQEAFAYEKEIIRQQQQQQQQQHLTKANLTAGSPAGCVTPPVNNTSTTESSFSLKITNDGLCVSKRKTSRSISSTSQLHSLEDTFDSIVDVTSNQEARIFAYYFRDAKNRLQVTEIFDYQRAAELSASASSSSSPASLMVPSDRNRL